MMNSFGILTHSYIIEGRDEARRRDFVNEFIMMLECEAMEDERPCRRCSSCRRVEAGTHPDVYHMQMSNATGYSSEKDIAPFIERLQMNSYGRFMVGVVDEADLLGEGSQNKLLKTLEEPGEDTIIILSAGNKDNLLPTVRSRCRIVRCEGDADSLSVQPKEIIDRFFYRYRSNLDKRIKTRNDALALLGALEEEFRDSMLEGRDVDRSIRAIELIENARKDILQGMSHTAALKRLYIMLY